MLSKLKPYEWLAGAALLCIAIFFWYKNYFIQDDAYIAFVYAKNFAQGHGLVWYPGLDEYGYTNFLYTLLVGTVMFWLPGVDPEYISATFNFTAYLAALLLTYLLTFSLSKSRFAAACAVLILATHHTFSAYASGGLETMVVTSLIMGFYYALFQQPATNNQQHYTLAILASAVLLTRLDSALLLFPGYVYLLYRHCEEHLAMKQSSLSGNWVTSRIAALAVAMTNKNLWVAAGIPTLCVLALLGWAKLYYGYALPNTFYAKIPGDTSMVWLGQRYILKYLDLHHYIPAVLLALAVVMIICHSVRMRGILRALIAALTRADIPKSPINNNQSPAPLLTLLAAMFIWLAYVVYVGGCFMEFRLLVPILPMFAVVVFAVIKCLQRKVHYAAYIIASITLVFGNIHHSLIFKTDPNKLDFVDLAKNRVDGLPIAIIEPIDGNAQWVTFPEYTNWRAIGKALHERLYTSENLHIEPLSIATINPGAIAYYSELRIIDTLGLNTRDVFKYSRPFCSRPGHEVVATKELYSKKKVHLAIATPQTFCGNKSKKQLVDNGIPHFISPPQIRGILIDIGNDCFLYADYRAHHHRIEELLENGTILDYRANQDKFNCPKWLCLR